MTQKILTRPDGSTIAVSGYLHAEPPPGAPSFAPGKLSSLPPRVDLRPLMTPVEDQKRTSSCASNATAGAYEYLVKRHRPDEPYDVSRLFIYWNARKLKGHHGKDAGSYIHANIESLKLHGACSEDTWPFDPGAVLREPHGDAYSEAEGFTVEHTAAVPVDLDAWKHALAEGNPIIFGMRLFDSFDKGKKPGLVPLPNTRETSRDSHGLHAMLCVGYSDKDQVFIVRNSWGPGWGDKGYCYIPYRYLMNEKYNLGDSWIIQRLENLEVDEETWGDDEESLLPSLTSELADMSDDDYEALLEACGDVALETRIALLFLRASAADGDLSDEEETNVASFMAAVMEAIGSSLDPSKVLAYAKRHLRDKRLVAESIQIFGEHLSEAFLAKLTSQIAAIAASDGEADAEGRFVDRLITAWQIAAEDEEESEDEESEDEESEDEESEDEESEDEESEDEESEDEEESEDK